MKINSANCHTFHMRLAHFELIRQQFPLICCLLTWFLKLVKSHTLVSWKFGIYKCLNICMSIIENTAKHWELVSSIFITFIFISLSEDFPMWCSPHVKERGLIKMWFYHFHCRVWSNFARNVSKNHCMDFDKIIDQYSPVNWNTYPKLGTCSVVILCLFMYLFVLIFCIFYVKCCKVPFNFGNRRDCLISGSFILYFILVGNFLISISLSSSASLKMNDWLYFHSFL